MPDKVVAVAGLNAEVAAFVRERVPAAASGWTGFTTIGFLQGDRLIAGIVYHDWDQQWGVVQMSAAADSPRWLTRDTLRAIFGFPFDELGCRNVVMRVSSLNKRMCSIAERFGFTRHVLPDLRAEGEDDIIYLLSRRTWNDWRHRHG